MATLDPHPLPRPCPGALPRPGVARPLPGHQVRQLAVLAAAFKAGDLALPSGPPEPGPAAPRVLASDSLFQVIDQLAAHPQVHVQCPDGGWGVVTRRDIQLLPCRTWLFGLVSAIELFFTERIQDRWPGDGWTGSVNPERLGKARQIQALRGQLGQRCALLDCLQLSDKGEILIRDPDELALMGFPSRKAARRAVANLESLRNNLAHSQELAESHWIQVTRLSALMAAFLTRQAGSGAAGPDRAGLEALAAMRRSP